MPQNWKTYKLDELVTKLGDGLHGTPKYSENGEYAFINGNNLDNGKINIKPETKRVDEDQYLKYKKDLNDRTLLVSINGSLGKVAFYNGEKIMLGKSACYFNVKDDVDLRFVKHVISSDYFLQYLENTATGSVIKNVPLRAMRDFPINLPPLPEQRAIAQILSSLDDKIELNLQMNKTLEEMAMTLYKHWFVDFEFPSSGGVPNGRGGSFPSPGGVREAGGGRNTANYMSLPYNSALKDRAKALRKAGNLAEVLFWQQVHKGKFLGLDFDRQKIIGNYIVDFYCAETNVVVEIDGSSHDDKQEYDAARDAYLESLGLTVIHIIDAAVKNDLKEVMEGLRNHPAFQAPLQRRGSASGYKSSGGKFIDSELGPIPDGWEVKTLDEIAHKKSETFDFSKKEEVIFVNTGDVQEGRFLHSVRSPKEGLPGQAKKAICEGDILYSEIRPKNKRYAFVNFDASDYVVSTKFMIINPKEKILNKLLYRILTMQSSVDHFDMIAEGRSGTFPQITFDAISEMEIILPPLNIQQDFQDIITPLELQQDELYLENQTLTALRDTLLPKLISGEVRVKDAAQTIAQAL